MQRWFELEQLVGLEMEEQARRRATAARCREACEGAVPFRGPRRQVAGMLVALANRLAPASLGLASDPAESA